jgi:hypothetical protein
MTKPETRGASTDAHPSAKDVARLVAGLNADTVASASDHRTCKNLKSSSLDS